MNKRWYVLQVSAGKEIEVKNRLEQQGYKVLVPLTERLLRKKGSWHKRVDIIFTGYVFIKMAYNWSDYHRICIIPNVIRLLGGGNSPIPLTDKEIMALRKIDMLRSISTVKFDEDGNLIPLKGILFEFKDSLISYKRRQRRAVIELEIAKNKTPVTVSFKETKGEL